MVGERPADRAGGLRGALGEAFGTLVRQVFVEAEGQCLCEMQGVAAQAGVRQTILSAHSDEIAERDRRSAVRVGRRPAEGSQRPSVRLSWALFMDERPWMPRRRASA